MGDKTKTKTVIRWWKERLNDGSQIRSGSSNRHPLCRPMSPKSPWKERVATGLLLEDFMRWSADEELNWHLSDFSKTGFMTIFYRISGAKMSTMRHEGARIKVAKFGNVTKHRKYVEELKNV